MMSSPTPPVLPTAWLCGLQGTAAIGLEIMLQARGSGLEEICAHRTVLCILDCGGWSCQSNRVQWCAREMEGSRCPGQGP